ncbi:hypothetical protein LCGC14_0466310 [marine sediment metagenome]|uniref:Uncharacterized protein n=1 Tax=marine sediment metagenome TaxID=412755 RepID=A0A0F9V0B9_9ZZZZ
MFEFLMLFDYVARGFLFIVLLFIVPIVLIVRLIKDIPKEIQFSIALVYLLIVSVILGWLISLV